MVVVGGRRDGGGVSVQTSRRSHLDIRTTACRVVTVPPALLAVAEAEFDRGEIANRIRGLFDIVYRWLPTAPVTNAGRNIALYDECTPRTLRLRAGVPVSGPFADADGVRCIELATGRAAHAVHVGAYGEMRSTYAALEAWCEREGLALDGQSWEVYGDWNDDESKLETGIYLRLR